jgi:hypothetical protein
MVGLLQRARQLARSWFGGPQHERAGSEHAELLPLESRTLMTIVPLTVTTSVTTLGTQLRIACTPGADVIGLKQVANELLLTTGTGWKEDFTGNYCDVLISSGAGNDSITIDKSVKDSLEIMTGSGNDVINDGGSGADTIYGNGVDKIFAGAGNDTVVTIGGTSASITGGAGLDSFWINTTGDVLTGVTAAETNDGTVHQIANFMPLRVEVNGVWTTTTPSKQLVGQTFIEPTLAGYSSGYANFSSDPLFAAAGPTQDDIQQGGIGDCYFLSTLAALAKTDPELIRQSIVSLGDGTYAIQFFNSSGVKTYLRIDGYLPTTSWGGQAYDATGNQGDLWAALLEKAWAYSRDDEGSYASINSGYMAEASTALGLSSESIYSATSATVLAQQIQSLLAASDAVTYATTSDMSDLIGSHAYTVDQVVTNSKGAITGIVLRNPWGIAGAGSNPDGSPYVTVTPTLLFEDFSFATGATSSWPVQVAKAIAKATVKKK